MREALRRQLPRIQHWSVILPAMIIAAVALVVLFVWVVWFRNTPERAVRNYMEAYRMNDVARLARLRTKSDVALPPTTRKQIEIVSELIAQHGRILDSQIREDDAVVRVEASFTGSTGVPQGVTVEVQTLRVGRDWLVNMEYAAQQMSPQFWGEM